MPQNDAVEIFLRENENIIDHLDQKDIFISNSLRGRIKIISNKANNNYIGYYQFKIGDEYYKIFSLPKILDHIKDEEQKKKKFVDFLKTYYRLKKIYDIKPEEIRGNIVDYSLESLNNIENTSNITDFISYKYLDALKLIEAFFRRHKSLAPINIKYISQSVKHVLDLRSNLMEPDKTKVHQIKKESISLSIFATVTLVVLKDFKKKTLKHLSEDDQNIDELKGVSGKVLNQIIKKFATDKNSSFKIKNILTHRISKNFKSYEQKRLYQALLTLAGMEHFYSSADEKEITRIHDMIALFFRPEDVYEWIIYDKVSGLLQGFGVSDIELQHMEIQKDKHKIHPTKLPYFVTYDNGNIKPNRSSKPDIVCVINNEVKKQLFIIDAKWKILSYLSEDDEQANSGKTLSIDDVLKLERDTIIRKNKYPNYETISILVFPIIAQDIKNRSKPFGLSYDHSNFEFFIKEISVLI